MTLVLHGPGIAQVTMILCSSSRLQKYTGQSVTVPCYMMPAVSL